MWYALDPRTSDYVAGPFDTWEQASTHADGLMLDLEIAYVN